MSLIQQALKRKLDEQQGTAAPPPPPLPPAPLATPPPHPPALISGNAAMKPPTAHPKISLAQPAIREAAPVVPQLQPAAEPEPAKGSSSRAIAVVTIVLLLAAAAVWYFRFYKQPGAGAMAADKTVAAKPAAGAAKPATVQATATAPSDAKGTAEKKYTQVPSAIPLPNVGAVHEKVDKMKEGIAEFRKEGSEATGVAPPKVAPPVVAPPKVEPAPVVATPKPEPVIVKPAPVTPPPVAAPAPVAVVHAAAPVVPVAPAVWPAVKITGVMATSQKDHRTAFINDSLLNVGDTVDGMVLIDVAQNSVVLEFKGERRTFPVGRRH